MDDILVFSKNQEEHIKHVNKIMEKLEEHKLSLKPEKCFFDKREIDFLGLIIGQNTIRMDPAKVEAIRNWPTLKTKREVQQFLGFVNFYQRFVQSFAKIAKPLTKLTGNMLWEWNEAQEQSFKRLQRQVAEEVTLRIPDDEGQFRIETDASEFATRAILSQQDRAGIWKPVAFISQSLNETEWNYEIYDKEMLAVM